MIKILLTNDFTNVKLLTIHYTEILSLTSRLNVWQQYVDIVVQ